MSTPIEITRPGQDGEVPITVEVTGSYVERQPGTLECEEIPAYFEDIKAVVAETAYLDEDEQLVGWSAGEPIKLTHAEEVKASKALLDDDDFEPPDADDFDVYRPGVLK